MAYSVFINLFPRPIAEGYFKLKSLSSKIQRTSSNIRLINQALFHQITLTFAKVKGHFGSLKDKHTNVQLWYKNKKLYNLITSKPKKLNRYEISVVNLSTENLDTVASRYGLHHSYVDKN